MADVRVHGTSSEAPVLRIERDERRGLRSQLTKAPFLQVRELVRQVLTDTCIQIHIKRNSVPRRLLG